MISAYPACFYKERNGYYSVIFPDLNHLATYGTSLEEAHKMSMDCLAGYIYTARQDNDEIPTPSEINKIDINSDYDEAFVTLVTVDVEEYAKKHFENTVHKNIAIPKWLSDTAIAKEVNLSTLLQSALIEHLDINKSKEPIS